MLDAAMFADLTKTVMDNITAILPVGLTIMGAMLGVSMIPKVIRQFF